jgi:pimeloyl-ACP methyl ester carboxylesterase
MGGMIAQVMATRRPDRVRSLTSIMSTPSSWIGMRPKLSTIRTIMRIGGTPAQDPDQAGEQALEVKRAMTTQRYPLDEDLVRDIGRRSFERRPDDEASDLRQRAAVIASGDRRKALARLRLPALVLHGEDDPVIRVKAGRATARAIPGAQLVTYPGLGHDLPAALWPDIIARLTALTAPTGSAGPPVGAVERGAQAGSAASIDRRSSSIESGR